MSKKITEEQRVDWLLNNPGFNCSSDQKNESHVISAWVPNGSAGNENGSGGKFFAKGKSRRDCVDAFILGKILRERF
jgi:hypothetical protein